MFISVIFSNNLQGGTDESRNLELLHKFLTMMMWFYITHTIFMRLGQCPIISLDFAGAMSIFGPDILPVIHQWLLPGLEPVTSQVGVAAHNY